MEIRKAAWLQWFRFHDYLFLTRKRGYSDIEAVANASTIRGFFFWLVWRGRWPE